MAIKIFYPTIASALGSNHHSLPETAPASIVNFITGWAIAGGGGTGASANEYSYMAANVERAVGTFTSVVEPSGIPKNSAGDCFRSELLNGTFAAGNWDIVIYMIAITAQGAGQGVLRLRFFKGSDPTGTNAVEFRTTFETTAFGNNSTQEASTATVSVSQVEFKNEYLFVQVGYRIAAPANTANQDAHLRQTSLGKITTTEFSPTQSMSYSGADLSGTVNVTQPTDSRVTPGPVYLELEEANSIPPALVIPQTGFSITPGPVILEHGNGFEVSPIIDSDLEASYSAKETVWTLGQYLI